MLPLLQRIRTRFKFTVQAMFFKRADALVVELEHVKEGLIRELGIPAERIYVIHNCLSSIYYDEAQWQDVILPYSACDLRLGFVGHNYPHKNTAIFPVIAAVLRHRYNINVKFYVTFTADDWLTCTQEFRDACVNVGPLMVAQCPLFYKALDAVVFPSLLECFSITPLEAMAMEKPLFVSDRPFNRDICGEHANYFDPTSPESAAKAIADIFLNGKLDEFALRVARNHAINFSNAKDRTEKYLELIARYS
jgi:glycosyltransferase involved in cell wall biosynthesis